ncbi:hypothetical protein [Eubacterium callanderi]|uniref:hypothetical protein n=1 Tax=Eubacterium callanderi TaxID=53442 RepID=UPI0022E635F4|nr:hypothetical protein [Eubacterium callanderi]
MKLKIESDFIYKGLRCVVIFTPGGYRCGYVGVTPESCYYGKLCDDLEIACHGGLTYSDGGKDSTHPVESDLWWFGFDCDHYEDGNDIKLAKMYYPERHILDIEYEGEMRSLGYVQNECVKIADQLVEVEK